MTKYKRRKKVDKKDLLSKKLTVRTTADDNLILNAIMDREGISKAEVIRKAIYEYYAKDFN